MAEVVNLQSKVKKGGTLVTETVITDTTTNIRDVGLTGGAAVDTVKILSEGATDREALALGTVQAINQQAGANFNQLVGGAGIGVATIDFLSKLLCPFLTWKRVGHGIPPGN